MVNTLNKEATIRYLQKISDKHYDVAQMFVDNPPKLPGNLDMPRLQYIIRASIEAAKHVGKAEMAETIIIKIKNGEFDE